MRLLVLGGTEFVGRPSWKRPSGAAGDVTVLNRGRHEPRPGYGRCGATAPRPAGSPRWPRASGTPVVDTWSAAPRAVHEAARLLAAGVGRYVYVSSRSVYAWQRPPVYEDAPVVEGAEPDAGETDYARDKRGGELAALARSGRSVRCSCGPG